MRGLVIAFLVLPTLAGCEKETRPNPFANIMPEVSGFDNAVQDARDAAEDAKKKREEEAATLKRVFESAYGDP